MITLEEAFLDITLWNVCERGGIASDILDLCSGVIYILFNVVFFQDAVSKSNHTVLTVDEYEFSDSRSGCLTRCLLGRKIFSSY